jgi:hypothetical protein
MLGNGNMQNGAGNGQNGGSILESSASDIHGGQVRGQGRKNLHGSSSPMAMAMLPLHHNIDSFGSLNCARNVSMNTTNAEQMTLQMRKERGNPMQHSNRNP